MKGLIVGLLVLIAGVMGSRDYHDHTHSHSDGYKVYTHRHPHGHKYGYKQCPLQTYTETVYKKLEFAGNHWEKCVGEAVRYKCHGSCNNHRYGYYYNGNGYYGGKRYYGDNGYYGNGFFGRRGGYYNGYYNHGFNNGYYRPNYCCTEATYDQKDQYVKFDCGHYGYKKVHWHTKEPTGCSCNYCSNH